MAGRGDEAAREGAEVLGWYVEALFCCQEGVAVGLDVECVVEQAQGQGGHEALALWDEKLAVAQAAQGDAKGNAFDGLGE